MPKVHLTQHFADNPPVPKDKPKDDYFDTEVTGFFIEARATGKATYYQRYRDKHGRLKQARIGPVDSMSLDKARSEAKKIRSRTAGGFDPNESLEQRRKTPTFKEFIDEKYIPHVKVYKRSWKQDEEVIDRRIISLWGKMKISEITRDDVTNFQDGLIFNGLKPGTVNRHMALVKFIFSLAEKWEVIEKSPARGVSKLADNNHKERYLSREEITRLLTELKNCKSDAVPDVIEFLILTGARKGEAMHMKWVDVDFERKIWTVPLSKSGKPRYIPLSGAAMAVLERRNGNESDYVFPNQKTGRPISGFHNTWDRIRIKAGIPDVRIHDLRHNFASLLINNGRSLYEVQKLLGHADISTTQRYAHLSQDTLQEATELVSVTISGVDDIEGE